MSQFETTSETDDKSNNLVETLSNLTIKEAPLPLPIPYYQLVGKTVIDSIEKLNDFKVAVNDKTIISFDAEGVNLSRVGSMTIVSVGIKVTDGAHVFIFDLLTTNLTLKNGKIAELKKIFENKNIEKIIHDCRQDSDALDKFHDIKLNNVFDTSIIICKLRNVEKRSNLNSALQLFDCPVNKNRGTISYNTQPKFWEQRPLTQFMIDYASSDVAYLFDLQLKLLNEIDTKMSHKKTSILEASNKAIDEFRGCTFQVHVSVPKSKMGIVIGSGGSNLNDIEKRSGAYVSCNDKDGFFVLAKSKQNLDTATALIKSSSSKQKSYNHYHGDY